MIANLQTSLKRLLPLRLLIAGAGVLGCCLLGLLLTKTVHCRSFACAVMGESNQTPYSFSGRLTYFDPSSHTFFLQNESTALRAESAKLPSRLAIGQRLFVSGLLDSTGTSPILRFAKIESIIASPLPLPLSPLRLDSDALKRVGQRVRFNGTVKSAVFERPGQLLIHLNVQGRELPLRLPHATYVNVRHLLNTVLTGAGIFTVGSDAEGGATRFGILVQTMNDLDLAVFPAPDPATAAAQNGRVLRQVKQVSALTAEQAARGLPVHIRGVVTWQNPQWHCFVVQDETGAVFVSSYSLQSARVSSSGVVNSEVLRSGQLVDIVGHSDPGDFAPVIASPLVTIVQQSAPPPVPITAMADVLSGRYDNSAAVASGIVHSLGFEQGVPVASLEWGGRAFRVLFTDAPQGLPSSLIDASVQVHGVISSRFNSHRQFLGMQLHAEGTRSISILHKPVPLSQMPLTPIAALGRFDPAAEPGHRERVRAIVTYVSPDGSVYLQDKTGALHAIVASLEGAAPGDLVDIAGFRQAGRPGSSEHLGSLMTDAELQIVSHGHTLYPRRVSPDEVLDDSLTDQFIQIDATVMDRAAGDGAETLLLRSGSTLFPARLEQQNFLPAAKGSLVRLSGIGVLRAPFGSGDASKELLLLLPSPGSVTLLKPAPWWTARFFLWLLLVAAAICLLESAVAILLRRRVNTQTEVIRRQLAEAESLRIQAESAALAKGQFLTNMSHEIRTPLNGVLGMLDLALSEDLTPDLREYLEIANNSGLGLLHIVNDVLDLSKIEAGRMTIDYQPFELSTLLDGIAAMFKPAADAKDLSLALSPLPSGCNHLTGDEVRIRQILINLVGNAIKFTHQGSVALRVSCGHVNASLLSVRIEVQDTGIGIALEHQANLFQNFAQGDSSTTRRYGGTGLGLVISRQLAELMGGSLGFHSQPAIGSTFWLELPLRLAPGGQVDPQSGANRQNHAPQELASK